MDPGDQLGPYEILSPLGAGGMGEVCRAEDLAGGSGQRSHPAAAARAGGAGSGPYLRALNMKPTTLLRTVSCSSLMLVILALVPALGILCQQPPSPPKSAAQSGDGSLPQPCNWTAEQDHQNMMEQLGIKALRPGPSGNEAAPNHANYDESRFLNRKAALAQVAAPRSAASSSSEPVARTDQNSMLAHAQLLEKAKKGQIDIYFEGDSITRRWGATDYPELLANWNRNFYGWNAADFGWGADRIENSLWRLQNGELDGVNPKIVVLLAGTNNVGNTVPPEGDDARVENITKGVQAVLEAMRAKAPGATIIVTGIFPRNDNIAVMPTIDKINANPSKLADGNRIRYVNINNRLAARDGNLFEGMMNAGDKLHPTLKGYQMWADALEPIFTELLGPPAKEDHAPPPTGDPSVRR